MGCVLSKKSLPSLSTEKTILDPPSLNNKLSILDASFVEEQRRTILHHLVGVDYHPYLSDDPKENFETLRVASNYNQMIVEWWHANASELDAQEAEQEWGWYRPSGYVFPLDFSSDYFAIAGPDLF